MVFGCSSLEKLYISNFIITNVLNMENIFDEYSQGNLFSRLIEINSFKNYSSSITGDLLY